MAREVTIGLRRYWIVSEPAAEGWRAQVLEVVDSDRQKTKELGIEASGDTRSDADDRALGMLQQFLRRQG